MTIALEMPEGDIRHYTPDYEIHTATEKIIAECKPEARLESEQAQQQQEIGQSWAERNGYRFILFTDTELRAGYQLENVRLFWRYARLRSQQPPILAALNDHRGACSIIGLCQKLNKTPQEVVPTVCHLLFHHEVEMDLTQPFSATTIIRYAGK